MLYSDEMALSFQYKRRLTYMEIFVITNDYNDNIEYVGTDVNEANSYLEIPELVDQHYALSIWKDGRLLNECIKRKIKR
jgi:hypothetical protein